LIKLHGASTSVGQVAKNQDDAWAMASRIIGNRERKASVVLKIVSPDILHKSDACGVKLNLSSESEVKTA